MPNLYIHVPFCRSKCRYCSFASIAGGEGLFQSYTAALKKEISELAAVKSAPLATIFVGGGTPTVLPVELLSGIIEHCRAVFQLQADAEISVEANPGTVDLQSLQRLAGAGVNRLSFGVQSFDDQELRKLGRMHSAREARGAVQAARAAGFANVSMDLMCGLPGQTGVSWERTLDTALSLSPEHLSVYQLTVEEETPLALQVQRGEVVLPDEDEVLAMDRLTLDLCRTAGLTRYEISNWSRPGCACRHNVNYWENGSYLACGASAVSFNQGVREKRTPDIRRYIEQILAGQPAIVERESLSAGDSFRETVIMGLRMVAGVDRRRLRHRYNRDVPEYYGQTLVKLVDQGLVEMTPTHVRLSERGLSLANYVMAQLV